MTNYIFINATTRAPVPLPFAASIRGKPVTVIGIVDGELQCRNEVTLRRYRTIPEALGLELITETDFMTEQETTK